MKQIFNKCLAEFGRYKVGVLGAVFLSACAVQASTLTPIEGERLSDWMLRQPPSTLSYSTGLQWQVPAEREAQAQLKRNVLQELNALQKISSTAKTNLGKLIEALPITGRISLSMPDARWLQAHPKEDPILKTDHTLVWPNRPTTVSVLMQSGVLCTVTHMPGAQVKNYLKACVPSQYENIDQAYIVQPDGVVLNYGIALWNQEVQADPRRNPNGQRDLQPVCGTEP